MFAILQALGVVGGSTVPDGPVIGTVTVPDSRLIVLKRVTPATQVPQLAIVGAPTAAEALDPGELKLYAFDVSDLVAGGQLFALERVVLSAQALAEGVRKGAGDHREIFDVPNLLVGVWLSCDPALAGSSSFGGAGILTGISVAVRVRGPLYQRYQLEETLERTGCVTTRNG